MCIFGKKSSTPVYTTSTSKTNEAQQVTAPTMADAQVTKASAVEREKTASLAGRNIKTSPRGLSDEASTQKKSLLGE